MSQRAYMHRIPPQPWMAEPATRTVLAAFEAGGVDARFVGGSVRDALLGLPIGDTVQFGVWSRGMFFQLGEPEPDLG